MLGAGLCYCPPLDSFQLFTTNSHFIHLSLTLLHILGFSFLWNIFFYVPAILPPAGSFANRLPITSLLRLTVWPLLPSSGEGDPACHWSGWAFWPFPILLPVTYSLFCRTIHLLPMGHLSAAWRCDSISRRMSCCPCDECTNTSNNTRAF